MSADRPSGTEEKSMQLQKSKALKGEITVPGDKSISHRAVMLGSLARGTTRVSNFLKGADCLSTIACFRRLGIQIEPTQDALLIYGKGLHGLKAPIGGLDAGNSGTTLRLLCGILAAQPFSSVLTGDSSIRKRPMKRIIDPLSLMGGELVSLEGNGCAPLQITGRPLSGIRYRSPVASAQVKSAVLLAGLYADGMTSVTEPVLSRNHSEIMLRLFGADVRVQDTTVSILPEPALTGRDITVPGDISSAAYFIAAACLVPGSELLLKNVGLNPTRSGILTAARAMGADITLLRTGGLDGGEPAGDLLVRFGPLHGSVIGGEIIPTLIDELPVLAVMAAFAEGTTVIRDAAELKVKESNRIEVMCENLSRMGADVRATDDGMIIQGGKPLTGAVIDTCGDHRIAMSFAAAALAAEGTTEIAGSGCVNISYPGFYDALLGLAEKG